MNAWEQIFNKSDKSKLVDIWQKTFNRPKANKPDAWQKMFHPVKAGNKAGVFGLDEKQCAGSIAFYGKSHEFVKRHCSQYLNEPKPKYEIVWT